LAPHPATPNDQLSLPEASDGTLALLISLSTLLFVIGFVPPFSEHLRSIGEGGSLFSELVIPILLAALGAGILVAIGMRRWHGAEARPPEDRRNIAFLAICGLGLLASVLGVRTLEVLVTPDAVAGLSAGRRALFLWSDLAITTGLIVGVSDGIQKILRSGRALIARRSG
jgi:hypothetical protein